MNPRRLTPSMSLLLVFEAAARYESYTRAAEELALSQSAISRQIQTLEDQLGITLFRREGRAVRLTDVGRRYALEMSAALGRIRSATLQAMSYQSGTGSLRLATLPTFGSKWLLPRLHLFYGEHPGVNVHIHSRIGTIDFDAGEIDAAITVNVGPPAGVISHHLQNEWLVAIAGSAQLGRKKRLEPAWVKSQPLLMIASNPQAWAKWFSEHALEHRHMRMGPSFELTSHLIQAVMAGIGVGLVPQALVEDEIKRGDVVALGEPMLSERSYYLVNPERNETLPSLRAFREWLLGLYSD